MDFCTGVRGIKFLYDGFFKEEMNPEYTPERLEDGMIVLFEKSPKEFHAYPDINQNRYLTADWSGICCRNIFASHLTSIKKSITIKMRI